jgi:cysteine synthase
MQIVESTPGAIFGNQFEGDANRESHFSTTAPEIWQQSNGKVDGVCVAAGTGGTIAGLTKYLRSRNPKLVAYLIDPPGSILADYVKSNCKTIGSATPGNPPMSVIEGISVSTIVHANKLLLLLATNDQLCLKKYLTYSCSFV